MNKFFVVGFSKSGKKMPVLSWLLRLLMWTEFSHTYIRLLVFPRFPSDKILHASEGKLQHMSGTQFDKRHRVVDEYLIPCPKPLYEDLKDNIFHELSGDDYSVIQNIGIIIVELFRWIRIKIRNPWPQGWNCSEYVCVVLKEVFPEYFADLDPNLATPKDLHRILEGLVAQGIIQKYKKK